VEKKAELYVAETYFSM